MFESLRNSLNHIEVLSCVLLFEETALLELLAGVARTGIVSSCLLPAHLLGIDQLTSRGLINFNRFFSTLSKTCIVRHGTGKVTGSGFFWCALGDGKGFG